jgi:hypothetical protein
VETGQTVAQYWETLQTLAEKRVFLLDELKMKIFARRRQDEPDIVTFSSIMSHPNLLSGSWSEPDDEPEVDFWPAEEAG